MLFNPDSSKPVQEVIDYEVIDYGDIIYDQPQNESFCEKIESVQYQVTLAITGAIQGTSCDKIYQELGLESLKSRRWYKCLVCIFKIMNKKAPDYLINLIPKYVNLPSKQGTTVYLHINVEQTVLRILFFLLR